MWSMGKRTQALLETLGGFLSGLPAVFSTPQWGGRAYKVDRQGKSKLLAFVALTDDRDAVTVSFKLDRKDADAARDRYDWIEPHSFRTLAPSGWLTATVRTKRNASTLMRLLTDSHTLHNGLAAEATEPEPRRSAGDATARRIDRVMGELGTEGWSPPDTEWQEPTRGPTAP